LIAPYVVSIPHTGTRFLLELLKFNKGFVHVDHAQAKPRILDKQVVICPLRDPLKVWVSWHKRNESREKFRYCWHRMNELDAVRPIFYFPVDVPQRDFYLSLLANMIGQELTTTWEPVGHEPGEHAPIIDLSDIYALPIAKRFYPAWED